MDLNKKKDLLPAVPKKGITGKRSCFFKIEATEPDFFKKPVVDSEEVTTPLSLIAEE